MFALLAASRLLHVRILWEGDTLALAAAGQMLKGGTLYRDIWFDKPPLLPLYYLVSGASPGWGLRLEGALYALLCCWVVYGFAKDLWSTREGLWAAGLLAFFSIFYLPAAVIPVASDLLMLAPHAAAVWMAWRRRPVWSGILAGVAFWVNPKGILVAAVCALWFPAGALRLAGGFAAVTGIACVWLWATGALIPYWREVWVWGRLYAAGTFIAEPVKNGVLRTLNWMGFHAAAVLPAMFFLFTLARCKDRSNRGAALLRWAGWIVIALAGVAAGMRFFPRYYFLLLPVVVLMGARGFVLLGRRAAWVLILLVIPLVRFAPTYARAWSDPNWRDIQMDRDSREAAQVIRKLSRSGDTLLVWGYRPEIFSYTGLGAATRFLDSQPLSGVPADRHLTESEPVETVEAARLRAELTHSRPTIIADGLAPFNKQLGITQYPDLAIWLADYQLIARTRQTIIYRRKPERDAEWH